MELRQPAASDGLSVHALIAECPPLDVNSLYCNLLQCTHFAATSVIAVAAGRTVGFVSGYLRPDRPDRLFIWQVAVAAEARGRKLGLRLLLAVLARPVCRDVRYVETTITHGNAASWALFSALADRLGAAQSRSPLFERDRHFGGGHDTEILLTIGPFSPVTN